MTSLSVAEAAGCFSLLFKVPYLPPAAFLRTTINLMYCTCGADVRHNLGLPRPQFGLSEELNNWGAWHRGTVLYIL